MKQPDESLAIVMVNDAEIAEYAAAHEEIRRLEASNSIGTSVQALGTKLLAEFSRAELDRKSTEDRWLSDLRQYKGKYDPDVETSIGNRSKAFVRKTRVKVKTVNSRIADLLFPAGSEKNWTVDPTPKPNIDAAERQRIEKQLNDQAQQTGAKVTPSAVDQAILASAKESAKRMAATVEDQLVEARYKEEALKAVHNGNLYGTGILKGPLVERKVRTRFRHEVLNEPIMANGQPVVDANGQAMTRPVQRWSQYSESYVVPFVESVPIWRFYPDMSATCIDDCRYVYELHSMPRHKLAELCSRPSFNGAAIKAHLEANPNGCTMAMRHFDSELRSIGERDATQTNDSGQYQLLERWGWISGEELRQANVDIPDERKHESFFANIWMLPNGVVIKAVLQPINGVTWPYYMYYFDKDESSIFGEGLGTVMRDDQAMLNAAVRLMLDNAAITAGPQLEVAVDLLHSMESVDDIVPWRVWKRNSKSSNGQQAVRAIELPNRLGDLSALAQMFEQNADETTAIPRYMSGENASQGAAGTAAGMSMLMAAANIVLKDLVNSWDEGVMRPFITAMYQWNMQFNTDNTIKGDYDVKARGTASLVAKEVRSRQLNEFAAMMSDPQDAPLINRHKLLLARAESLEMAGIVKTEDEIQAEQQSEGAKAQQEMQKALAQAQVEEAGARAKKTMAEAEVALKRAQELDAKAALTLANIDKIVAETVSTRVEAVFAALQGAGVATRDPFIAPAADEILKSTGFNDANGAPDIADLNRRPVQEADPTQIVLARGQAVAPDPRVQGQPMPAEVQQPTGVAPQTGMVGRRAGIETERIE